MFDMGKRLKQFRLKLGYNQKEMASLLGISANAICNYERNIRTPSSDIIMKLAKSGLNLDWYFTGIGNMAGIQYFANENIEKKDNPRFPKLRNFLIDTCINRDSVKVEWANLSISSIEVFLIYHLFYEIEDLIKKFEFCNNKYIIDCYSKNNKKKRFPISVNHFYKKDSLEISLKDVLECYKIIRKQISDYFYHVNDINENLLLPIFQYGLMEWQYSFETTTFRIWYNYKLNDVPLIRQFNLCIAIYKNEDWLDDFISYLPKQKQYDGFVKKELYFRLDDDIKTIFYPEDVKINGRYYNNPKYKNFNII